MSESEQWNTISPAAAALVEVLSTEPLAAMDAFGLVQANQPSIRLAQLQNALYELERAGLAHIDQRLRVQRAETEAAHATI